MSGVVLSLQSVMGSMRREVLALAWAFSSIVERTIELGSIGSLSEQCRVEGMVRASLSCALVYLFSV